MKTITERVTDVLVEEGLLKVEQLKEIQANEKANGSNLLKMLVESRLVSDQDMLVSMGRCIRTPPINLNRIHISPDVVKLIPPDMATNYLSVPVSRLGKRLYVAMADPLNIIAIDDIRHVTQMDVFPLIANEHAVAQILQATYPGVKGSLEKMLTAAMPLSAEETVERRAQVDSAEEEEADEAVVVRSVNMVLAQAIRDRASDIHIEPQEKEVRVRFGIDGQMVEIATIPRTLHQSVVSRIKIMATLDIAERRLPQDGRLPVSVEGREVDLRVSVLPTMFGERVVMRILDKGGLPPNLEGFTSDPMALQWIRDAIHRPHGMVLVTGPTGSGKTTTLYRALQELNTTKVNIITVEDPVEYQLGGINQVQVNADIGLTFAAGLRSILRQAPNIVLVGEIRDNETADIAIKAALTGHLVLSTLHTNDAPSAVARLVDMGVEPFLVGSTVVMVIAQRLARKLCPHCREKFEAPERLIQRLGLTEAQVQGQTFYRSVGCSRCRQTGFIGRTAVVEVMRLDEELRDLIIREEPTMEVRKVAEKNGMKSLRDFGLYLANEGITSLEEVLRVTAAD